MPPLLLGGGLYEKYAAIYFETIIDDDSDGACDHLFDLRWIGIDAGRCGFPI